MAAGKYTLVWSRSRTHLQRVKAGAANQTFACVLSSLMCDWSFQTFALQRRKPFSLFVCDKPRRTCLHRLCCKGELKPTR